jgi:NhaA family Na+:H+ antiporter
MYVQIKEFLKLESSGGIALVAAAALAVMLANSPFAVYYDMLKGIPVEIRVGSLHLAKPLLLWINDGLMAIFFFIVGLELKKEVLEGSLSDLRGIALPAAGALGGMLVPAVIYTLINHGDAVAMNGWAIPTATDIAFALGVLMLLGDRVPTSLKVFLVSLAIFDDVGAIIIIAVFYTGELSMASLGVAFACLTVLCILNFRGVTKFGPYLLIGVVMWVAVLKSGVHATLAGVVLAMFIPINDSKQPGRSPLRELEHDLNPTVAFGILPLFAFVNSGVKLDSAGIDYLLHPVTVGTAAGLFFGKQIGVFAFCWMGVMAGIARKPEDVSWRSMYGVSLLCGVGFTMSMFIGTLAFGDLSSAQGFDERLGIISGSVMSGLLGYLVLRRSLSSPPGG